MSEEEEKVLLRRSFESSPVLIEQDSIWPPWPWPPWGGDDGDDDGDNGGKKPVNKTKRVQKLAKEVVKFESEIAHASLDL